MRRWWQWLGALGLMVAQAAGAGEGLAWRALPIWSEVALQPVGVTPPPVLWGLSGERESFFLVLLPEGPRVEVAITVGALRGPKGATIGPERVRIFRAHYVDAPGVGPLADALVPITAGTVRDRHHPEARPLPFVLEVEIPRTAEGGAYVGELTARVGGEVVTLPLTVHVVEPPVSRRSAHEPGGPAVGERGPSGVATPAPGQRQPAGRGGPAGEQEVSEVATRAPGQRQLIERGGPAVGEQEVSEVATRAQGQRESIERGGPAVGEQEVSEAAKPPSGRRQPLGSGRPAPGERQVSEVATPPPAQHQPVELGGPSSGQRQVSHVAVRAPGQRQGLGRSGLAAGQVSESLTPAPGTRQPLGVGGPAVAEPEMSQALKRPSGRRQPLGSGRPAPGERQVSEVATPPPAQHQPVELGGPSSGQRQVSDPGARASSLRPSVTGDWDRPPPAYREAAARAGVEVVGTREADAERSATVVLGAGTQPGALRTWPWLGEVSSAQIVVRGLASEGFVSDHWPTARSGLLYPPGAELAFDGVAVESARLHVVRDALDDLELLRLCRARGLGDAVDAWSAKVRAASELERPRTVHRARQALLSELGKPARRTKPAREAWASREPAPPAQ